MYLPQDTNDLFRSSEQFLYPDRLKIIKAYQDDNKNDSIKTSTSTTTTISDDDTTITVATNTMSPRTSPATFTPEMSTTPFGSTSEDQSNYDSTKLLIIFMVIVFAVLLLFILIYYYCVKGMKSSTIARQTQKSTSGSITDEKARNIFAHPERHLAVDQSQRASPSPSNDDSPIQMASNQERQHVAAAAAGGGGAGGSSALSDAGSSQPLASSAVAVQRAPLGVGTTPASGVPSSTAGSRGDPFQSSSTNTMTESQVAAAAATLSTSESTGAGNKSTLPSAVGSRPAAMARGKSTITGSSNQTIRSPSLSKHSSKLGSKLTSKLGPKPKITHSPQAAPQAQHAASQAAAQQQQQALAAALNEGRGNPVATAASANPTAPKKVDTSNSGGKKKQVDNSQESKTKSKTKSGSQGKQLTVLGTLANLRDTMRDTMK